MVTICIPSRTEKFLQKTILDVLKNATGEIEILPILDGYTPPEEEIVKDPRVRYLSLPFSNNMQKRHGINMAVAQAKGEYVMSLDAHCMVAPGFDEVLVRDHQPNWVQVPRRNRLDAANWCLQEQHGKPPIDYEYVMYPFRKGGDHGFGGFRWDARTLERWNIPIDETMEIQASCWFMTKEWFNKNGFMQIEGYTGWGQEGEEITFTTWCRGGQVMTNKNTWYAHLHKGQTWGRMYHMNRGENARCYDYSYKFWMNEKLPNKVHTFEWFINKFMPIPGWRPDWKEVLKPTYAE